MWKWMTPLFLLGIAFVFWPERAPEPAAPVAGSTAEQRLLPPVAQTVAVAVNPSVSQLPLSTVSSCPDPQQLKARFSTLRANRQRQSEALMKLMQEAQLRPELQLQYLRELGGDIAVLRSRTGLVKDGLELLMAQQLSKIVTSDLARLKQATEQGDYRALQDWLLQSSQPADVAKLGYLQFTLLQVILQLDPQLQPVQLQQLLDSGLKADFFDLMLVSRAGRDLQIVDMLQQSYGGDLTKSWQENQRTLNLTLLAAQQANASLFDYWLAHGIPAALGPLEDNAFDLLPLPVSQSQLQQQLPLVRTLLRLQLAPVSAERQWFWLQQLPEAEAAQLQTLLQHDPAGPDLLGSVASSAISQELSHTSSDIQLALTQLWQCQGQNQLPAIISATEQESAITRMLRVSGDMLRQVHTDPVHIRQVEKFEQSTAKLQEYIRQADWQAMDTYLLTLVKDRDSLYFNNRFFAQEYLVHQMVQLQAPPAEIIKRLRFFGRALPPGVLTLIQLSDDPQLLPALQKAGYRIPPLVAK